MNNSKGMAQMATNIENIFYVRETTWHGLGNKVDTHSIQMKH